jgi:alkanesulfonate monooxygenase SsuD/methylene tetrahydromethanopterin reductase-like flavin-dependent oxidoreductase (luciferase family)
VPNVKGFNQSLLVFAGEHTDVLARSGWSKDDIRRFLVERARRTVADFKRATRIPGDVQPDDERTWRHVFEDPADILVVCAGGRAGSWSACLPGWGKKWTRAVTTPVKEKMA